MYFRLRELRLAWKAGLKQSIEDKQLAAAIFPAVDNMFSN